MTVLGRVDALWVFPVKSMSGSRTDTAEVLVGGLAGDRSWAVVDASGETVTAKHEPLLREAVARIVDGRLQVDLPGAAGLDAAAADAALSAWLGREVHLEHRGEGGFVDVSPVHVVSTGSLADAVQAEECDACDVAAPRANLVLDLVTGNERDWVGRTVLTGPVALAVSRLPRHCLGAYADVVTPGSLRVGDEVRTA